MKSEYDFSNATRRPFEWKPNGSYFVKIEYGDREEHFEVEMPKFRNMTSEDKIRIFGDNL